MNLFGAVNSARNAWFSSGLQIKNKVLQTKPYLLITQMFQQRELHLHP